MPTDHRPRLFQPGSDPGVDPDLADDGAGSPEELWAWLPRLSARQVGLERAVKWWSESKGFRNWLDWLNAKSTARVRLGLPEVVCRGSGLQRPGLIAQFRIPTRNTRLAFGLETPITHALVDGLLGYDRPLAESRLQLTPVEWGVCSYLAVRALATIDGQSWPDSTEQSAREPGRTAGLNLLLDRVGPDAFDPTGLGALVTIRWPVRVGETSGTARLWISESTLAQLATEEPGRAEWREHESLGRTGEFASLWHAEAGFVAMPQGLKTLRQGGVLPIGESRLGGTPQSPVGPVNLACKIARCGRRFLLPTEPIPASSGRLVRLTGPLQRESAPRDPLTLGINQTMTPRPDPPEEGRGQTSAGPTASPTDIPVTLTVELGRLNLTLDRLADLRPGDVLELGRHSREPVELTSNGRLVARGELILIDTELGVRVTNVFL